MAQPGYITIPGEDELPNALVDDYYRAASANYWPQPKYNWWEPAAAGALTGIGQGVGSYFTQQQQIENEQRKYQMELQTLQEQARLQEQAAQAAYDRQQLTAAEARKRQGEAFSALGTAQQGGSGSRGLFESFENLPPEQKTEMWEAWPAETRKQYLQWSQSPAQYTLEQNMPSIKMWADLAEKGRQAERQAKADQLAAEKEQREAERAQYEIQKLQLDLARARREGSPDAVRLADELTAARAAHERAQARKLNKEADEEKGLLDKEPTKIRGLVGMYGGVIMRELTLAVPVYTPDDIRAIVNGNKTFFELFVAEATFRSLGSVSTRTDTLGAPGGPPLGTSETRRGSLGTYSTMPDMVAFLKRAAGPQATAPTGGAAARGQWSRDSINEVLNTWPPAVEASKAAGGILTEKFSQFASAVLRIMTAKDATPEQKMEALNALSPSTRRYGVLGPNDQGSLQQRGVLEPPPPQVQEALRFILTQSRR